MTPDHPASRVRRLTLLGSLYAAQGLPFGFFTLALPVLLREAGWSLKAIALLQFLALPWALKFLWAPWVDHVGSRKHWLLGLQGGACLLALGMAALDLTEGSMVLFAAVLAFNLLAATQDIVTDGLAVRWLDARERGLANALQVGAYRLGMVLGGGVLLWVFAHTGWSVMYLGMAAMLSMTLVPIWGLRQALHAPRGPRPPARHLGLGWWHRAWSPGMLTLVALIVCFRFGDQMVSSLITPFVSDQGVDKATIAFMKGALGSGTSLVGAVMGGWLLWRVGRRHALWFSGLAQALAFGLYLAVAWRWAHTDLLWVATVAEGLTSSMASVALFALMMDAADPDHAGTDYTLLASIVNVVGSLGSMAGAALGDAWGYGWAMGVGTVLSVVGVGVLVVGLDRHPTHERVARAWR